MIAERLIIWGLFVHLFADWFLQNEWMALNKTKWTHPAAWVHSGIHLLFLLAVFPWRAAVLIAAIHFIIDLRFVLVWWRKTIRQTTEGPAAIHLAFWQDQAAHVLVLAVVAKYVADGYLR